MTDHVIALVKHPKNEMRLHETLITAALQKRQVTKIAFGTKSIKSVGQKVSFHGKVQDKEINTPLSGAVIAPATDGATPSVTKADGTFRIDLPAGDNLVFVSYVGYE